MTIETARELLKFERFTDAQLDAFKYWEEELENDLGRDDRLCVYYPTGKGKTPITLTMMYLRGVREVLVVAPPLVQPKYVEAGLQLGITVHAVSHAKFRMKDFKIVRDVAIIVDEFHLLGGHTGQGWKKLDRTARGLQAPLIICSATPSYNDAERVYCVAHVLDPHGNKGGFIGWLYEHCTTENNPFGVEPIVTGFRNYENAEEFLAHLPGVVYIPDDAPNILQDVVIKSPLPDEFDEYNLDVSRERIMASQMEKRHRKRYLQIVDLSQRGHDLDRTIREEVYEQLLTHAKFDDEQVLIYCSHSTVAEVLYDTMVHGGSVGLVTGDTTAKDKAAITQQFRDREISILIGTATLATGTDGLDRVCDTMVILDDTDDDSLRRQLVGRILARGVEGSNDNKVAYRFVYED